MWVFGYGSLMWDNVWQKKYGRIRKVLADLPGYRRTFNKASVENWGTKKNPCPTLNVEKSNSAVCRGIAFEFPDDRYEEVLDYLKQREGKDFKICKIPVLFDDGNKVSALVSIYNGKNLIYGKSDIEKARMVSLATGKEGKCICYVECIANKLSELSIDDPEVYQFWESVRSV